MSDYPVEIDAFHQALQQLKGIQEVCSGIDKLDGIHTTDLSLPDYAHLPLATLLRTKGGLKDELMIQFEFTIDKSPESLASLEFLSWFVRDQSRNGKQVQLRPFALPPQTAAGRQLGSTLKFHIDCFFEETSGSLQPVLEKIADMSQSLKLLTKLYDVPLKSS